MERLASFLRNGTFRTWEEAFSLFKALDRRHTYVTLHQSWAGSGELDADRLVQLKEIRAQAYLTDLVDDRILMDPPFAGAVAQNYLYFRWAKSDREYFSVHLEGLWGEESPAVRHVVLLAFEQLADMAGARLGEKGFWDFFDPAFCGIMPQNKAGADLQGRMSDAVKAWWKGPGASEEAKALECLSYLGDTVDAFWMSLPEPPEEYKDRVVRVCRLYPRTVEDIDAFIRSDEPARQEAAVRRLRIMWKARGIKGRGFARYEQTLRSLASSADEIVAANALLTLAVARPEVAVEAACAALEKKDAAWWLHYHALEVIGSVGVGDEDVERALRRFSEQAEESLSQRARRLLQRRLRGLRGTGASGDTILNYKKE